MQTVIAAAILAAAAVYSAWKIIRFFRHPESSCCTPEKCASCSMKSESCSAGGCSCGYGAPEQKKR